MPGGRHSEGSTRRPACDAARAGRAAGRRNADRRIAAFSRRRRFDAEGAGHLNAAAVQANDVAPLIQVALTPIFLISAIGVTLNVLTSRLARIVDRARVMESQVSHPDYRPE